MRLLMIAWGYLPYSFSEGLCNGKLVYALDKAGIHVDVISRVDNGNTYEQEWHEPWTALRDSTVLIDYPRGNALVRALDVARSSIVMDGYRDGGVRWARRAYQRALQMLAVGNYDAVLTRSPNDICHLIGYKLKKKTGIKWLANWNDPADPIWPGQYEHKYAPARQRAKMKLTAKLLAAADINTFPSDSLRSHFTERFPALDSMRTEVIPHIGLCDNLWPAPAGPRPEGRVRLLHSGNLSAERDPETTFAAMRRLVDSGCTDFEFHIMGHVNQYTEQLIERYGLQDYVKFIGSYPYMQALAIMQTYDVLVILEARLDRGIFFASKFTDYLQTGLPVLAISPTRGFAADMLKGRDGEYLADNESVDSIHGALSRIIADRRDGILGKCDSADIYNTVSPQMIVDLYRSLISKK